MCTVTSKKAHQGLAPVAVAAAGRPVIPQPPIGPIDLPCSDGLPMADSDAQARTMLYSWGALEVHFGDPKHVYIAIDTFVYYWDERSGSIEKVAPDLTVVFGVDGRLRRSYRVWEEGGRVPDFVMEVVSPDSGRNDLVKKRSTYEQLGVTEYVLYDPCGDTVGRLMEHRLQGEALRGGRYRTMERRDDGSIRSNVLGLDLRVRKEKRELGYRELLFRDPRTGRDLETHAMVHARRSAAEERARRERRARVLAEERAGRERLDRIQAEAMVVTAQREAKEAVTRIAELEALLGEVRGTNDSNDSDSSQ